MLRGASIYTATRANAGRLHVQRDKGLPFAWFRASPDNPNRNDCSEKEWHGPTICQAQDSLYVSVCMPQNLARQKVRARSMAVQDVGLKTSFKRVHWF